jgi:hypothetical protein
VTERQRILKWGGASGLLAAAILLVMIGVGLGAGPDSTQLLQPTDPEMARTLMRDYDWIARAGVLLDDLFVLAYTGAFLGLAALICPRSRWLAGVAMFFALSTAVLDFWENARLLTMALGIGGEASFASTALRDLHIISQLKYSCSHLAAFLLGLALARQDRLSWAVGILLFLFPIASTAAFISQVAVMARMLLMWLLLVLGGLLAWRHSRHPPLHRQD